MAMTGSWQVHVLDVCKLQNRASFVVLWQIGRIWCGEVLRLPRPAEEWKRGRRGGGGGDEEMEQLHADTA